MGLDVSVLWSHYVWQSEDGVGVFGGACAAGFLASLAGMIPTALGNGLKLQTVHGICHINVFLMTAGTGTITWKSLLTCAPCVQQERGCGIQQQTVGGNTRVGFGGHITHPVGLIFRLPPAPNGGGGGYWVKASIKMTVVVHL